MKYLLEGEETKRLRFRLLKPEDFDTWIDIFKEKDVPRFFGMDNIPTPKEQCEEWFQKIKHRYEHDTGGLNVLIDKHTNEFIGQCGILIQEVDGVNEMEIGYSILPKHWKKGYATEAAQKCRDYAFENNFADYLISIIHIENNRSKHVALKNGMTLWKNTTFWDMPVNVFRIDKTGWENIKKNEKH